MNISSKYSHPGHQDALSKLWYKINKDGKEEAEMLTDDPAHVQFHDTGKNHHILTIKNLKKNDSAKYIFSLQKEDQGRKQSDLPGVTLVVTGNFLQ